MFEWVQTVQTFKVDKANNVKATQVFFQSWDIRDFDAVQNVQTFKVKIVYVFKALLRYFIYFFILNN